MSLLNTFNQNWNKIFPHLTQQNCYLIAAVSGGADSIVLVDLLQKAGFDFTIAHCNFQLRGLESERDEQSVRTLSEQYNKELLVKHFDTEQYAKENKIGIEEAARKLRYAWFDEIMSEMKAEDSSKTYLLATAHHADDNIETVLINLFRGTGLQGLRGIMPLLKEQKIIRPLLQFRKEELLDYAKENNLDWVEDSSNASDVYTRNFFRNKLIPSVKEVFPQAEENVLRTIERLRETAEIYKQAIEVHKQKLLEQHGNEFQIHILKLKKVTPLKTIVWEIISAFDFTAHQVDEVIKLLDADNGAYIRSASHRIIVNRNRLIIAPLQTEGVVNIVIEKGEKKMSFEAGVLTIESTTKSPQQNTANTIATLDATGIKFPLLLRKWKQGDYFYPLGMRKKKKLSKFFIDNKLSKTDKEKVWVIESDKKIIWVIGYRIDDRFKLTDSTTNVLKLSYENLD